MILSPLERDVLSIFLDQEDRLSCILRDQVETLIVVNRKMTGVGFQTNFVLPPLVVEADDLETVLGGVNGYHPNDPDPLLFNLFIRGGRLRMLEGIALSNEWPSSEGLIRATYSATGREQNRRRLRRRREDEVH